MANVAYIRVSTKEQNEDRQVEALQKFGIDKFFCEKRSGKNTNRPELQKMLEYVREGDTVYIHSFDRLARSTKDLLSLIDTLNAKGVRLVSNKENLDSSTATGKLMITMIAAINEFELSNLHERQAEGIACAQSRGAYAKPMKTVDESSWTKLYRQHKEGSLSKSKWAETLGVSRPTLNKLISRYEAGENIYA